jgi:hypothetical protein
MSGNHTTLRKVQREARRAEKRLAKQRRKRDVTTALPAGTGWTGTGNGDLEWAPLQPEDHRGSRLRERQSGS